MSLTSSSSTSSSLSPARTDAPTLSTLSYTRPKNRSVSVSDEEFRLGFEALSGGSDSISVESFAQKVKDFHIHNFRELVGESGEISFDELRTFLMTNDRFLVDDPIEQAMKV
jgi:hypothetical protein